MLRGDRNLNLHIKSHILQRCVRPLFPVEGSRTKSSGVEQPACSPVGHVFKSRFALSFAPLFDVCLHLGSSFIVKFSHDLIFCVNHFGFFLLLIHSYFFLLVYCMRVVIKAQPRIDYHRLLHPHQTHILPTILLAGPLIAISLLLHARAAIPKTRG